MFINEFTHKYDKQAENINKLSVRAGLQARNILAYLRRDHNQFCSEFTACKQLEEECCNNLESGVVLVFSGVVLVLFWLSLVLSWCCSGCLQCCPGVVLVLFWCYLGVVLVLFWCCPGVVLVLSWCCPGVVLVLSQCYPGVVNEETQLLSLSEKKEKKKIISSRTPIASFRQNMTISTSVFLFLFLFLLSHESMLRESYGK